MSELVANKGMICYNGNGSQKFTGRQTWIAFTSDDDKWTEKSAEILIILKDPLKGTFFFHHQDPLALRLNVLDCVRGGDQDLSNTR